MCYSLSQCIAFLSEQNGNLKFHLQPLSKMNVEGGLVTSYGNLRRYLLTPKQKNQHPNAPSLCCGAAMARAGQRGTYLPWTKTLLDSVLWLCLLWLKKRWTQVSCWQGKSHFLPWCHNLCYWGECVTPLKLDSFIQLESSEHRESFYSRFELLRHKIYGA